MWTLFWDMHSGGGTKEGKYEKIYIEADEKQAKVIFYNRFGHNPERVTCTCCGEDYSISSEKSLSQLSAYHRNCHHDGKKYVESRNKGSDKYCRTKAELLEQIKRKPHIKLKDYVKQDDVLVIRAADIKPDEKIGDVPSQGYVWMD